MENRMDVGYKIRLAGPNPNLSVGALTTYVHNYIKYMGQALSLERTNALYCTIQAHRVNNELITRNYIQTKQEMVFF